MVVIGAQKLRGCHQSSYSNATCAIRHIAGDILSQNVSVQGTRLQLPCCSQLFRGIATTGLLPCKVFNPIAWLFVAVAGALESPCVYLHAYWCCKSSISAGSQRRFYSNKTKLVMTKEGDYIICSILSATMFQSHSSNSVKNLSQISVTFIA